MARKNNNMDNKEFDKIIKGKADAYKDTEKVPSEALKDLHNRLDGVAPAPWYEPYKNIGKYAAGIALVSLINFSIFWWWHINHEAALLEKIDTLSSVENLGDDPAAKPSGHEALTVRVDTVFITKTIAYKSQTLPRANNNLKTEAITINEQPKGGSVVAVQQQDITKEVIQFLTKYKLATVGDNGNIYLQYRQHSASYVDRIGYTDLIAYTAPKRKIKAVDIDTDDSKKTKNTAISTSLLKEIEKHRMHGVGLRWGPTAEIATTIPEGGTGKVGVGAGAALEFIFSPTIRLETEFKYQYSSYQITGNDISAEVIGSFPSADKDLGTLKTVNQQSHIISTPLRLKMMHPLSRGHWLFASGGFSPQYYFRQKFNYNYGYDLDTGTEDHFDVDIEASKKEEDGEFYLGSIDLSFGIEKKLANENYLSLSAFYNYGLNPVGVEQRKLSLLGIRSSLRFNLN